MHAVLCMVIGFCLTAASIFAQNTYNGKITAQSAKSTVNNSSVVSGSLGLALDEYMRRLEGYGFSGALLAAKDGQIYLAKGYMVWLTANVRFP